MKLSDTAMSSYDKLNPLMRVPVELRPYVEKLRLLYALKKADEVIEAVASAKSFDEAVSRLPDKMPKAS